MSHSDLLQKIAEYEKLLDEGALHFASLQKENDDLKQQLKKEKLTTYHLKSELEEKTSSLLQQETIIERLTNGMQRASILFKAPTNNKQEEISLLEEIEDLLKPIE